MPRTLQRWSNSCSTVAARLSNPKTLLPKAFPLSISPRVTVIDAARQVKKEAARISSSLFWADADKIKRVAFSMAKMPHRRRTASKI